MHKKTLLLAIGLVGSVVAQHTPPLSTTLRPSHAKTDPNLLPFLIVCTAATVSLLTAYSYYSVKALKFLWEERTTCKRRRLSRVQSTPESVKAGSECRKCATRTLAVMSGLLFLNVPLAFAAVAIPVMPLQAVLALPAVTWLGFTTFAAYKRCAQDRPVTGTQYAALAYLTADIMVQLSMLPFIMYRTMSSSVAFLL